MKLPLPTSPKAPQAYLLARDINTLLRNLPLSANILYHPTRESYNIF